MSWQDRDYARVGGHVPGGVRSGMGGMYRPTSFWGGGLWGGSIVKKLLVANVALYFLCYFTESFGQNILATFVFFTPAIQHGQIWRLLTAQYLHDVQLTHLLFNMLGLYFLGSALERAWGNKKFLAIYTIAGLCGFVLLLIASSAGLSDPHIPALGASGCVLGLLGAAAVMMPHATVYVYFLFPVKIRTCAVIFGVWWVYNILGKGENYGGDICHLAGMLFGAWWAWKGDLWWATRRGAHGRVRGATAGWISRLRPNPRRGGKRAGTGAWEAKMATRQVDHQAVDRILKKVYDGGVQSLTPAERKTLIEATERQRQAEAQADRAERL